MIKRFRNIGLLILLLLAGQMAAQVPVLDSVCSGAERHYRVDGEAGSTYSWILTPPAGPAVTLPSDADTLEIMWNYPAGIYELVCTQHALNGCDADAVYGQVIIIDQADVDAGPDDQVCGVDYYKLLDATAVNYSSLLWQTSGDGTFDDVNLLNATYSPGANDILAGTVTLSLTAYGLLGDGGCNPAVSTIVLSIVKIVPVFEPIGPLCQFTTPPALPSGSDNVPPVTGTWSPSSINTGVPGITLYTFTPDASECAITTTMPIEVLERVVPLFDPIGPLVENTTAPLLPASSNNVPAITGTWDPPLIDTSIPGTYTYTFTPDSGQCASVTDMEITVQFDYLQAITGPGKHCLGDAAIVPIMVDRFESVATFQLKLSYNVDKLLCEGYINVHPLFATNLDCWIDQVAGIITIQWQGDPPVTFDVETKVLDLLFTPKEPGMGQLQWYTGATESYFTDQTGAPIPAEFYTADMTIYDPPEIILPQLKTVCTGEKVKIIGIASSTYPPLTYQWTYPDGTVTTVDPTFDSVTETNAGNYTLLVTDSLGCDDQQTVYLLVSDNPVAEFHGTDTLTVPVDYVLEAGRGMDSYLWNTGETTESIVITTDGMYTVEMVTSVGCTGIDSVYVIVLSDEIPKECLYVPNAFTPNRDGLNDTFMPVPGCELTFYQLNIFDRWGELLFVSHDVTEGWDGVYKGNLCPADAYVYKIVYRTEEASVTGLDIVKTGVVTIVYN